MDNLADLRAGLVGLGSEPQSLAPGTLSLAGLGIAVLLLWLARRSWLTLDLYNIPAAPGLPLLGHLLYFNFERRGVNRVAGLVHRMNKYVQWMHEYGPFVRLDLGFGRKQVLVTDPATIAQICSHGSREQPKDMSRYGVFRVFLPPNAHQMTSQGSIATNHSDAHWKAVRKSASIAFSATNIKKKLDVVKEKVTELADKLSCLGPDATFDASEMGMRLTLDVFGAADFRHDFRALKDKECPLLEVVPGAVDYAYMREGLPKWLPDWCYRLSKEGKHGHKCVQGLQQVLTQLVTEMAYAGRPADADVSIAAQLLRVIDPDTGGPLSYPRLGMELGAFLIAGFETTGHSLSYILLELACHPEIQDRLFQELQQHGLAAVGPSAVPPRELDWDDLAALSYTNNVIKEAMRLHPVGTGTLRVVADKSIMLGPYRVPRGTPLLLLTGVLHMCEWLFPNAHTFDPDRWQHDDGYFTPQSPKLAPADVPPCYTDWYLWKQAQGRAAAPADKAVQEPALTSTQNGAAHAKEDVTQGDEVAVDRGANRAGRARKYLPFSDGPRNCIGQTMAMMELRAAIAVLASRFSFSLAPEAGTREDVFKHEHVSLTLQIRGGVKLRARPR